MAVNMTINVGKRRGLQATSTARGLFTILAFDHRGSLRRMMCPDAPDTVPYADAVALKLEIVAALAPHASGVLLDPIYGASQAVVAGAGTGALPGRVGLLVALEETGYAGDTTARRTRMADSEPATTKPNSVNRRASPRRRNHP